MRFNFIETQKVRQARGPIWNGPSYSRNYWVVMGHALPPTSTARPQTFMGSAMPACSTASVVNGRHDPFDTYILLLSENSFPWKLLSNKLRVSKKMLPTELD